MTSPNKLTITSQSSLCKTPSNSSAKYCLSCFTSAIVCAELYPKLQSMRENRELCDISITVEASSYKTEAHRLVLAIKSPYFKTYFGTDVENKEFKFSKAFSAESVEGILGYMYEKELNVLSDNVDGYLRTAMLLELQEVIDRCCHFITTLLSISNSEHYIALANELNLSWLTDKVFLFLEWNFLDLTLSDQYKQLDSLHLQRIVRGRGLRIAHEETLYHAVIKWYRYKPKSRKESLETILQSVNFVRTSPPFLKQIYPELVDELGMCKDKLTSAQNIHTVSPNHLDIWTSGRRSRVRDVIYLFSSNDIQVDRFDEVQNTCLPCPQMNIPCKEGSDNGDIRYALQVDKYLFLVSARKVWRLNWEHYRWDVVGEGTCIRDAGVCEGLGSIIVVGGRDSKALKSFDVMERKWSKLPPMQTGRRGPGVVCHSKVLYVLGGYNTDRSQALSTVESLSMETREWSLLPSMRIPRCRLCCVTFEDKIFAMGGRDNVTNYVTVETFDLKARKWEASPEHMIRAREEFCATVYEGMIICFGGRGVQSVECYDPKAKGKWMKIGTMGGEEKQKTGLSCVVYSPPFEDLRDSHELLNPKAYRPLASQAREKESEWMEACTTCL